MEEGLLIVLDYDKICRLCLQTRSVLSNLFDIEDNDCEGTSIVHQIKLITSIDVAVNESLPYQICYKCRYEVEIAYQLRETVIKSHQLLSGSSEMDLEKLSQVLDEDNLSETHDIKVEDSIVEAMIQSVEGGEQFPINTEEGPLQPGGESTLSIPVGSDQFDRNIRRRVGTTFACQLCLRKFYLMSEHSEHVSSHYSEYPELIPYHLAQKPFLCNLCEPPRNFNFRSELVTHHREHLKMNPYKCTKEGCATAFRSKDLLRQHSYAHAAKKFVCEMCGAAFRRKSELGQHCIRHQDEGVRYECPLCRIVCKNRISYKAHIRHHEQGKRFKCPRGGCPKAFFSRGDLEVHERSHTNDKRYKCHLCVCAYISQSQLNRHLKQHQRRKVTKCDKCTLSFSDYTKFCNHRITTHGEWLPHRCRHCKQGYQNVRALDRHVNRCKHRGTAGLHTKHHLDMEDLELMKGDGDLSLGDDCLPNSEEASFLYITDVDSQEGHDTSPKEGPHYMILHQVKHEDHHSSGEQDSLSAVMEDGDGSHYMIIKEPGAVWQ